MRLLWSPSRVLHLTPGQENTFSRSYQCDEIDSIGRLLITSAKKRWRASKEANKGICKRRHGRCNTGIYRRVRASCTRASGTPLSVGILAVNQILDVRPVHVYINSATSRLSAWQKRSRSRSLLFVESLPTIHYPHQRKISSSFFPPPPTCSREISFHVAATSRSFSRFFRIPDTSTGSPRAQPIRYFAWQTDSRREVFIRVLPHSVTQRICEFPRTHLPRAPCHALHVHPADSSSTSRVASRVSVLMSHRVIDFSIARCSQAFSPRIVRVPRDSDW